ncbi:MAG: PKD domain-containing protein [Flavobacteriales bacterium]
MKKLIILILAFSLITISSLFSQTYNMSAGNDTTCSGTFYDNGGLGLYGNNLNLTQTFFPNTTGSVMKVTFTSFVTDPAHTLTIRDGGPAAPVIGVYSGTSLNGSTITATNPAGSLTFTFNSTSFGVLNNGWTATLSCAYACQPFTAIPDSTAPMADTNNEIKICVGTSVNLVGDAIYPNTGTYYNQSNATSTFTWKTGDGFSIPGQNAIHTFNGAGIFDVSLVVTDTNGCTTFEKGARVVVAKKPNFKDLKFFPNDTICFGDTAIISLGDSGLFTPFTPPILNAAGVTFLPDGSGVSYRDTIPVSIFSPVATFATGFLEGIYINMEHSYLGDLEIRLTCPNGSSAILKQPATGGNTFLGEPVDPPTFPVPLNAGIGYTYDFTNINPQYGTMAAESNTYTQTYADVLGNNYLNQFYLPAGTYTPFQNLSTQLNGCPLNGNWIITVTDNLASDNGYIFFWGLNFDTLIRPPSNITGAIIGTRDSSTWSSTANIIGTLADTAVIASPAMSGTFPYTYTVYDDFGCSHDTTVNLVIKNKPKSNAGPDFVTCLLNYQLAPVPSANNDSSHWTMFSPSATATSLLGTDTTYTATTTVNEFGVYNYILNETVEGCPTIPDTVTIAHVQVQNTIDIDIDKDTICIPELVNFTNNSDMTFFDSIYWAFGDGNTSNDQGSTSHTYSSLDCFDVTVTLVNSLGCTVDSVLTDVICSYPTPVAGFNFSPFEAIVPDTEITFTNTSVGATIYVWDFAGLGTSINRDDSYEFPKTEGGIYPVTLYVANEGGCFDQITQNITIKNPLSIWIPTAFTPNGDGLNETFRVVFNNDAVTKYSIRIFNRWGEMLFFSEDPNFEWDGTLEGTELPSGVYIWQINGKEEFQTDSFTKFGHVTLTR